MNKISGFTMVLVLFISACQNKNLSLNNKQILDNLNSSDTFLYKFPHNESGKFDSSFYKLTLRAEAFMRLKSLQKGFDSIQIRIRYGCVLGRDFIVILENSGDIWTAEVSELIYHYKEDTNTLDSISLIKSIKTPKSGWEEFISKLFKLKILSLEDQNDIKGYYGDENVMDGCGAAIQIATKKIYRLYRYDNPDIHGQKNWQTNNIINILTLINKELEIKDAWPTEEHESFNADQPSIVPKEVRIEPMPVDSQINRSQDSFQK